MVSDEVTRIAAIRLGGAADALNRIKAKTTSIDDKDQVRQIYRMVTEVAEELGINPPYRSAAHDHH